MYIKLGFLYPQFLYRCALGRKMLAKMQRSCEAAIRLLEIAVRLLVILS